MQGSVVQCVRVRVCVCVSVCLCAIDRDILYTHKPQTLFIHLTSTKDALCNPCQLQGPSMGSR